LIPGLREKDLCYFLQSSQIYLLIGNIEMSSAINSDPRCENVSIIFSDVTITPAQNIKLGNTALGLFVVYTVYVLTSILRFLYYRKYYEHLRKRNVIAVVCLTLGLLFLYYLCWGVFGS
jgi:hypothetical protein